jgi:Tfp pilus assembly protein PilF
VRGELALWLWAGDQEQAGALAGQAGHDADADNDLAVLDLRRGRLDEAKVRLDRVLARHPDHPAALWNRALLFERRGEVAAAIRDYQAVAARQESGWSDEARERTARLRAKLPAAGAPPAR